MIVTCPGCTSKYRVRNEAVPAEGARMRCPKCETLFLAKPPAGGESAADDGPISFVPPTNAFAPTAPTTGQAQISMPPQAFGGQGASMPPHGFNQSLPPQPQFGQSMPPQFGQPPSAFQQQPFGGPPSQPFGQAPQPPAQNFGAPNGFGNGSGFVPQAPNTSGPLTAMMRTFDPSTPPSSTTQPQGFAMPSIPPQSTGQTGSFNAHPGPSLDDDPFARINVDPRVEPGMAAPTIERMRPVTQTRSPSPSTQVPMAPSSPPSAPSTRLVARPAGPPSMAMVAASWLVVVVGAFGAVFGVVFAAWTSEAIDLDASLMPVAERSFGAQPPYSFVGRDDEGLDVLRQQATAKETAGDLPAAAVLWRRVQDRDPADAAAKTAVPRVLTALGERLR